MHLTSLTPFASRMSDTLENQSTTPIWYFSTISALLAADASLALLAANARLIASSGPSWAAWVLVAKDGCSPAAARNLCWLPLSFIQPVTRSTSPRSKPTSTTAPLDLFLQKNSATLPLAEVTPSNLRITVITLMTHFQPVRTLQRRVLRSSSFLDGGTPSIRLLTSRFHNPGLDVLSVAWNRRFSHLFVSTLLGNLNPCKRCLPPELPQLLRPMQLARVALPTLSCCGWSLLPRHASDTHRVFGITSLLLPHATNSTTLKQLFQPYQRRLRQISVHKTSCWIHKILSLTLVLGLLNRHEHHQLIKLD